MSHPDSHSNPWRHDLPASVVVFLVALPLCLGIALASNAPLFSGIVAGIVGGVVVALLGGSEVSVSGPAAGLTVIVASSILAFGGNFQYFVAALALAGVLQFLLGLIKAGTLVDYVPTSVVRGMLAAIGIVIILKQIPHALGYDQDPSGEMAFVQSSDGLNTFEALLISFQTYSYSAVLISAVSVAILLLWDRPFIKKATWSTYIPGPLIVVLVGILINELLATLVPGTQLMAEDKHLVALPIAGSLAGVGNLFVRPDFSGLLADPVTGLRIAVTIALVATLETLLSLEAADKLDPLRRISRKNKELRAQGVANFASGLLGGLPLTAVIVRTSANVYAGGLTRRSAFVHGVLLALCALLIPGLLNRIPLASLAVILVFVGYKLASVKVFQAQWAHGRSQFVPFLVTILAIVFTDLLIGVLIGVVVGFFWVLRTLHQQAFSLVSLNDNYLLRVNKDLTFLHKNELKQKLQTLPDGAKLLIDGQRATVIDIDIYDELIDFRKQASYRGIEVEFKNLHQQAPEFIQDQLAEALAPVATAPSR